MLSGRALLTCLGTWGNKAQTMAVRTRLRHPGSLNTTNSISWMSGLVSLYFRKPYCRFLRIGRAVWSNKNFLHPPLRNYKDWSEGHRKEEDAILLERHHRKIKSRIKTIRLRFRSADRLILNYWQPIFDITLFVFHDF